MSWLNFNESLTNIKGQISNFASGVLAEGIVNDTDPFTELSAAKQKIQELQNLCASQDVEITSLRRQNAEFMQKISAGAQAKSVRESSGGDNGESENWFWDPPTTDAHEKNTANNTISNLTKKIEELETEKKDLIQSLEQLDLDCQRTTEKLVTLKDDLQLEHNKLKVDFDWLKTENEELSKENKRLKFSLANQNKNTESGEDFKKKYNDLKISLDNLEQEKLSLENINKELNSKLQNLESDNEKLNTNLSKLNSETISLENYNKLSKDFEILQSKHIEIEILNKSLSEKNQKLSNEISKITQNNNLSDDYKKLKDDELLIEKQELHKKYVAILSEMVKKYVDYQIPEEFIQKSNESPEISEFNSKVESVLKLLLDFKWKTETLERKLCEISHEKTVAITEKNHEIEKLLHNSEILSQEVITKTQTIKDYEIECSELIKNNDLLIAELQQYKNNGLQTISESNEDNLLLLETQLEQSNKRIKELELVINDLENSKQETNLETQTELDYIKKQLNMTGKELSQSKTEYKELLKHYKQLELDNKNYISELTKIKSNSEQNTNEKNNLQSLVDKLKSEIENTEYKFTETNVNFESLKEDIQSYKLECTSLSNSNENLVSINKELNDKLQTLSSELNSLKNELETVLNIKNEIEIQNRNLIEKLQSSKMSETGLKLQNDTTKRELDLMTELNSNLDQKVKKLDQEILLISKTFQNLENCSVFNDIGFNKENISIVQKLDLLKNKFQNLNLQENNSNNTELNNKIQDLLKLNSELMNVKQNLESKLSEIQMKQEHDKQEFESTVQNISQQKLDLENKILGQSSLNNEIQTLSSQLVESNNQIQQLSSKIFELQQEINSLTASKSELVQFVTAKHEENIKYHSEIQRLNHLITLETEKNTNLQQQLSNSVNNDQSTIIDHQKNEIEKLTDQNNFLKEKCEKLAQNLLEEQSNTQKILSERQNISEREQSLTKELERLRMHLVEIEDSYTKELLLAEEKNKEMQAKVNEIEQRERDSSTIYTSVSIRANQQVETLQNQLHLVTTQRDDLQKKISEAEDKNNKQFAALTNLQCVLEQFQRDREKDILTETERIRRQITVEKQKQNELQEEINVLKAQLEESKQGLKAASRLSDQVEKSKQQVLQMKEEVSRLQGQLLKTEEKYTKLSSETGAKVDKNLIKNLIVGFISANNNLNKDQSQILKIISTVLDFSQQDNDKLALNKTSGSWLNSILHPVAGNTNLNQQSLSEAFVRFLESESQPKPNPPTLMNMRKMSTESNASSASNSRQTPLLLSEVVLPTFADFAQNRNSSSILKDVLKEN